MVKATVPEAVVRDVTPVPDGINEIWFVTIERPANEQECVLKVNNGERGMDRELDGKQMTRRFTGDRHEIPNSSCTVRLLRRDKVDIPECDPCSTARAFRHRTRPPVDVGQLLDERQAPPSSALVGGRREPGFEHGLLILS